MIDGWSEVRWNGIGGDGQLSMIWTVRSSESLMSKPISFSSAIRASSI